MSKKYRQTRKSSPKSSYISSSDIKLFVVLLLTGICGMSVFVFWSDIKKFTGQNHENKKASSMTESLILEDARLYESAVDKLDENKTEKVGVQTQDKYEKKDKEYLEKLINKH